MKCPNCGYLNPAGNRYCGMCGTGLANICPVCSTPNPPDYRFCGQCGNRLSAAPLPAEPVTPDAAPAATPDLIMPPPLEGERRIATVILADVFGSTDLLERVGTERWVILMNDMFQILETEIYRFGGQVDQFRGDGLVAFFGARTAHEDDPERAVLAALAMQRALQRHTSILDAGEGITLSLRVGVNTGEVIVTNVGDRARYSEDTAMGEAITIAARMEQAAQPGTVLVSAATHYLIAGSFEWEALGELRVKGFSTPIAVYRPLRYLGEREETLDLQSYGLGNSLIGRDAEFDALIDAIESLRKGRGGIVLLSGERGMGKSFLVTMVREHLQRREVLLARAGGGAEAGETRPIMWLRGRGRSYDQSTPFALWLDLLRDWLNLDPDVSPEAALELLWEEAAALWGDAAVEHFTLLAIALSLPVASVDEARIRDLDGEHLRERVSQTLIGWVQALAHRGPVIITFTNVHWADTSSIELLQRALPVCDMLSVLWVVIFRPERTAPVWDFQHYVETEYPHRLTSVTLVPLDARRSGDLLDSLIGPDVLPPATRALLLRKAEGNPYYIRELLLSLAAAGALAQDPATGEWRTTREIESLDLPDSLQSVLRARVDSLDAETRRILQVASSIGPVFWFNVLAALLESLNRQTLQQYLNTLLRAQLIYEREPLPYLGMTYVFKSTLICDIVYESLLSAQRIDYHRRVARYFERYLEEEVALRSQYYGLLAYHYRQAGDYVQELYTTIEAAKQAQRVFANVEALDHYAHALDILDALEAKTDDPSECYALRKQRVEVLLGRGDLLRLRGELATWRAQAPVVLSLAQTLENDPHLVVDALLEQVGVADWNTLDEVRDGRVLAEEALALARRLGDRSREMRCLAFSASQLFVLSEPEWLEVAERSLALARELGDRRLELMLLTGVGNAFALSDSQRSAEYLELAFPVAETVDDPDAELQLIFLLGVQMENSVDYTRRIRDIHEKALRLARKTGNRIAEAQTLMFLGQIRALYLGDYEAGLSQLEEALAITVESSMALYPLLRIAQIRIEQGRLAAAETTLAQAHLITGSEYLEVEESNPQEIQRIGRAGLGLLTIMLYNAHGDEPHLRSALRTAASLREVLRGEPQSSRHYEMTLACKLAETHSRLSQLVAPGAERAEHQQLALARSREALALYADIGHVRPIELTSEEILFRHSQVLRLMSQEHEADDYLTRAHEEMMRKHALIPEDSDYRRTFLMQMPLHRQIRAAYALHITDPSADGARVHLDLEE